jgi:hypothetical protein
MRRSGASATTTSQGLTSQKLATAKPTSASTSSLERLSKASSPVERIEWPCASRNITARIAWLRIVYVAAAARPASAHVMCWCSAGGPISATTSYATKRSIVWLPMLNAT